MNKVRVIGGTGLSILLVLMLLAIVGHCSTPVSKPNTAARIDTDAITFVDREKHWTPPVSARDPTPIAPLPVNAPPPTPVTPVISKATDKSISTPTEEVPEKTVDNGGDLAPLPKLTPMPRNPLNVCYPGRKQTFYYRGVLHWRCLY